MGSLADAMPGLLSLWLWIALTSPRLEQVMAVMHAIPVLPDVLMPMHWVDGRHGWAGSHSWHMHQAKTALMSRAFVNLHPCYPCMLAAANTAPY